VRNKYRGGEVVGEETVLYGDVDTIFMIRKFPLTGRFMNDLTNLVDSISKGKSGKGALRYVTGINIKEYDLEARRFFKMKDIERAKIEESKSFGAGEGKFLFVPKPQKETPVSKAIRDMEKRRR
jgi:hypothetical protein